MVMALVSASLLAAGRRLRSPTPDILRRCSSKTPATTPTPTPTPPAPTVSQAIAQIFEDFASFLKAPKPDLAKASKYVDELSKVVKDEPSEVVLAKARGLAAELSKVLNVSTFETRLLQTEVRLKTCQKLTFGVGTLFVATLMTIPASVFIAKLDSDNEIKKLDKDMSKLQARIAILESGGDPLTRVSHEFKIEPEKSSHYLSDTNLAKLKVESEPKLRETNSAKLNEESEPAKLKVESEPAKLKVESEPKQ